MVIDLTAVERRLADFGMYWGVRLALEAWITALPLAGLAHEDEHEAGLDHAGVDEAVRMLSGGSRPFVLPDEYRWENT